MNDDRSGKTSPANKTKPQILNEVKRHIQSFPVIESHYCRPLTMRKYFDLTPVLTLSMRGKELIVEKNLFLLQLIIECIIHIIIYLFLTKEITRRQRNILRISYEEMMKLIDYS